ncbi:unnamed protein product [Acanthoscelides obtectus]|uniref:Uncharacterized protein n=1 Tax=Acanthoscelides obtectus TaxID=200917 RepID=A0A9P0PBK0_ACAOB|nr:unnamed protein product [Acanthoscelides obtectus]CAK1664977.1 hypothetical protein AOBTE_LOCUS24592 [Acanthoscelides obtectus]
MVKVKDDLPPLGMSDPLPTAPASSLASAPPTQGGAGPHSSAPRKQRPFGGGAANQHAHLHHHHHHGAFQHYGHYHRCSFPADGGDMQNGASPAKFYFGPGFEPQQQGSFGPGPSQNQGNEYIVFFHVNPGVTISFQMGENLEILRGELTVTTF